MPTRDETYALIGEIATLFSNLDYVVTDCLMNLIDNRMPMIGGILTNEVPFARKIALVRHLASARYCHEPQLEAEIGATMQSVDDMRKKRNDFIHGMWVMDDALLKQDVIRCMSMKWDLPKLGASHKQWKTMVPSNWTRADLLTLRDDLVVLVHRTLDLLKAISSTPNLTQKMNPP